MSSMIKINNTLINPDHITHIELNARVYDHETSQYRPGVIIHLAVISGEFGGLSDGAGGCEPYRLEFRDEAADALRPWLDKIFFLWQEENGEHINLPKPVKLKHPNRMKEGL